ncbi:MAG: MerR family transcriptional regulator [Lachnospiraceae bacterium]|nr:MerR family transcriptional regulator [Lachnospiraceae bacterium]
MKTVNEVSKLTGVSIRTLHYYDEIGLLHPTEVTEAGYRLYDDTALERLQHIMLFRELEFPLKEIKEIVDNPNFDRSKALEQQIKLLTLKKEHIENLIIYARGIHLMGVKNMDFSAFDTKKMDEYATQAKASWGDTDAYREYEKKTEDLSKEQKNSLGIEMMGIFKEFGQLLPTNPGDETVQAQVKKLQDYISQHFYTCTNEILSGLGKMYAGGGSMTENIDKAGGKGTAEFVSEAIEIYCK